MCVCAHAFVHVHLCVCVCVNKHLYIILSLSVSLSPRVELMQTELHHIQTLTVMSEVFRRGMLDELQLDWECVARIFPCLDPLLLFHRNLFGSLQERRYASAQPGHPHNYCIHSIGDILLQQVDTHTQQQMQAHACMLITHKCTFTVNMQTQTPHHTNTTFTHFWTTQGLFIFPISVVSSQKTTL